MAKYIQNMTVLLWTMSSIMFLHTTKRMPKPKVAARTTNPQGQSPDKSLAAPPALGDGVGLAEFVSVGLWTVVPLGVAIVPVPVEPGVVDPVEEVPLVFGVADAAEEVPVVFAVDDVPNIVRLLGPLLDELLSIWVAYEVTC